MGKTVILMRHGKAQDHGDAWDDFERTLIDRGRKETRITAERILSSGIIPEVVVSSPASRTAGTARIVADVFDYPEHQILYHAPLYNGSAEEYLDLINSIQSKSILIVGHNPEMQSMAYHFGKVARDGFPTASAVAFSFDAEVIGLNSNANILFNSLVS
jgi:phosphohistidine phosphatase